MIKISLNFIILHYRNITSHHLIDILEKKSKKVIIEMMMSMISNVFLRQQSRYTQKDNEDLKDNGYLLIMISQKAA